MIKKKKNILHILLKNWMECAENLMKAGESEFLSLWQFKTMTTKIGTFPTERLKKHNQLKTSVMYPKP